MLLFIVTTTAAADTAVWEVKKGDTIVYLGGTIHVLSISDYPLPAAFDEAYRLSEIIYFEVDPAELASDSFIKQAARKSAYPEGTTLRSKLSDATWSRLDEYLQMHGLTATSLDQLKPGAIMSTVMSLELINAGVMTQGVDLHFFDRTVNDDKNIAALETATQQIDMLAGLGDGNEEVFIRSLLDDMDEFSTQFNALREAWRHGNNEQLVASSGIADLKLQDPETYRSLLSERNKRWMILIEQMFDSRETEFVLVGAMHLVGDDGLLSQLLAKGYSLRQLQRH